MPLDKHASEPGTKRRCVIPKLLIVVKHLFMSIAYSIDVPVVKRSGSKGLHNLGHGFSVVKWLVSCFPEMQDKNEWHYYTKIHQKPMLLR